MQNNEMKYLNMLSEDQIKRALMEAGVKEEDINLIATYKVSMGEAVLKDNSHILFDDFQIWKAVSKYGLVDTSMKFDNSGFVIGVIKGLEEVEEELGRKDIVVFYLEELVKVIDKKRQINRKKMLEEDKRLFGILDDVNNYFGQESSAE